MRSVGEAGEIEPETESFLVENEVESGEFPPEVLACLPTQRPWTIPQVHPNTDHLVLAVPCKDSSLRAFTNPRNFCETNPTSTACYIVRITEFEITFRAFVVTFGVIYELIMKVRQESVHMKVAKFELSILLQEEVQRRRDFREECVFTIDPETARVSYTVIVRCSY